LVQAVPDADDVAGYPTNPIARLLYGGGLRLTEPLDLRSKDLNREAKSGSHLDIQQLADSFEPLLFDFAPPQSPLKPSDGNRYRAVVRHPRCTRQFLQFHRADA
jgi:hypothetical protein